MIRWVLFVDFFKFIIYCINIRKFCFDLKLIFNSSSSYYLSSDLVS